MGLGDDPFPAFGFCFLLRSPIFQWRFFHVYRSEVPLRSVMPNFPESICYSERVVGFVLVVCYRTEVVQLEKHLAQPKKHPNWSLLIPKFYQTQKTCMFQLEWCFHLFTSEKWLELTISNHFCSGGRFFLLSCCEEKYFDHDFEYRHVILPKESHLWFAVLPFGLWIPNHILYMYMIHTHIIISSYHQYINIFSYHICIYVPYVYLYAQICIYIHINMPYTYCWWQPEIWRKNHLTCMKPCKQWDI